MRGMGFSWPFLRSDLVSVVKPFLSTRMLYPHLTHGLVISCKIKPKPNLSVNLPRRSSVQG
jgi:hypothetical protein